MALTVEQMSRMNVFVASDKGTFEQFAKAAKLSKEDEAEAKEFYAELEKAYADAKPGEQIMVPGEWT